VIQSKQIKPIKIKGLTTQQIFIGLMCLLCIAVVLFSFYFYWFDVFTLYHCCVASTFIFIGLMCLICITVVLLVLLFLSTVIQSKHIKPIKIKGLTTQQ
jgi:hypothetical protein